MLFDDVWYHRLIDAADAKSNQWSKQGLKLLPRKYGEH